MSDILWILWNIFLLFGVPAMLLYLALALFSGLCYCISEAWEKFRNYLYRRKLEKAKEKQEK